MKKVYRTGCAEGGGANLDITKMPPPSDEYRDNFDAIFRKKEQTGCSGSCKCSCNSTNPTTKNENGNRN